MYNYSIIIPHRNSPSLLCRCLKSIPQREDLEIIVVDDNSDDNLKPNINRNDVNVILLNKETCNGAGHARNIGLSIAKGKWLLFADADDYYVDNFMDKLDEFVNTDYDVVYFNFYQYLEGGQTPIYEKISNYVKECAEGKISIDFVKYKFNAPWNKMIKTQFVRDNEIFFEEIPIANDMFFAFQVGFFCRKYFVANLYLYNYIVYKRSQTKKNWTSHKIQIYVENIFKSNGFYEFIKHKEWKHGVLFLLYQILKMKRASIAFKLLFNYFYTLVKNNDVKYTYIKKMKMH